MRWGSLLGTAAAGIVLIVTVIVSFPVGLARGHNGSPYAWLGAIAGLAYTIAIVLLRWRS